MMMDMRKHPNCGVPHEIHAIGIFAAAASDAAVVRAYIEGFNWKAFGRPTMSAFDAVDGSSTGARVPWMWVLLRPPQLRGAKHASS
jgi:hypothetical protein